MTDIIVYLGIGAGRHVAEIEFAVQSALRQRRPASQWSVVLYTDRPDLYSSLDCEVRLLEAGWVKRWTEQHDYLYLAKIGVLAEALTCADRAVLIDGDTYFTRSPDHLFARIRPGHSLMHLREGRPNPPEAAGLVEVLAHGTPSDLEQRPWSITHQEILWNSGVVGLHAADARLCAEAEHLTRQLLDLGFARHSRIAEMVGFGSVLSRRTKVAECPDVVVHYWMEEIRAPFLARMSALSNGSSLDASGVFDVLWSYRPKFSLTRRLKMKVKRSAARVGVEL